MTKLWQARLARHAKAQSRYLQRVFNDHFVLVLLILMGGLLYAYSQFVRDIATGNHLYAVLAAAALALSLPVGRMATLLEEADAVFLLPQLAALPQYLTRALRYSALLPAALQALLVLAAWPLLGGSVPMMLLWLCAQWWYKLADMFLQRAAWYHQGHRADRILLVGVALVGNVLAVWVTSVITLLLAGGVLVYALQTARVRPGAPFDLNAAIHDENARMTRIYRFYNLFTDVPGLGGGTHRRRYLDTLLGQIKPAPENTWRYLYARGLLRSEAYGSLSLRLTIMGAALMLLTRQWWLALELGALLVYLLGIQLVPLAQRYDEIVFTHLYPQPRTQRAAAWVQVVTPVLMAQATLIGLTSIAVIRTLESGVVLIGLLACALILPRTILVARVRKSM